MAAHHDGSATNLPSDGYQLAGISPKAYEHPADRAATAALASVPMLDQMVRKLIEFQYERALRASGTISSRRSTASPSRSSSRSTCPTSTTAP